MRSPTRQMMQDFIKRWTIALKTSSCCKAPRKENMSLMEKKNIIKQTASIAIAATKGGSTAWSRAIIADEYDKKNSKILVEAVMGNSQDLAKLRGKNSLCMIRSSSHSICKQNFIRWRSKMMIKSSTRKRSRCTKKVLKASSLAKSIINKQTQVLKSLMPGGEGMNQCCLIEEALDYIVSLKAQVDVMKELVNAAEYMKKP